ncbi:hypothetical protein SAMN05443144_109134 [Fodinibius roseus]|uniref:20S proteasome, alpha and beta subunits n=1 Tax=Fodinibius roseus TaxID=1194090 RepID=A0A1M5C840_9BACT|nr:hypothetical protein [Fodinibius roseus]SHF50891.1 hypothetical protein SAMN05443144_109134 [Fodinibius roseus]
MSAVATIRTPEQSILLSDGLAVDTSGADPDNFQLTEDRIHSRDCKKVAKINDTVGLLWVGNGVTLVDEFATLAKGRTGREVADELSEFLKLKTDSSLYNEPWYNINVSIACYENGQMWGYSVRSKTPIPLKPTRSPVSTGCYCMAALKDPGKASQELEQRFVSHRATKNVRQSAIAAFTDFVKEDDLLGGEIFCEVINPKTQSKFRKALMN